VPHNLNPDAAISDIMQSLRRIVKAIQDYSHEVSGKFGVTGPQLWALKTISWEGSLPLGELSKKMYLDPSTISGVIDRLESKGYVTRDRNQEDRRVVKVQLTPAGQSLVEKAPNPAQGKMIHGLRKLSKNELSAIYHSVDKLVEIMEVQNLKVTFFFDQETTGSEKTRKVKEQK
jgi:DNA-binding MarR family transcriptional regulator